MNDVALIEAALRTCGLVPDSTITPRHHHPGTSGRILRFTVGDEEVIAKIADRESGHDRAAREYRVLSALGDRLTPPAPRLVAGSADPAHRVTVVLVGGISGTPGDSLKDLSIEDLLATVHAMTPIWRLDGSDPVVASLELPRWGAGDGSPSPHRRRARRFHRRTEAMCRHHPEIHSLHEPILDGLLPRFEAIASLGGPLRQSLIHGDLHPDNLVFSPDGPRVLDWQTASLGDPLDDVVRLSIEGCPGLDLAALLGLTAGIPDGPPDMKRLARAVILTYAGLVSSLGGRPEAELDVRESSILDRLFRPGHLLPLVEESLCRLRED